MAKPRQNSPKQNATTKSNPQPQAGATTPTPPKKGIVYIGHIPHGFYEDQMRSYFSQFGEITRLRLSRSKKTARSKGYAYIEFADEDVARIVADTMNGYLMLGRRLRTEVVSGERLHKDVFKGCDREFKKVNWGKVNRREVRRRGLSEEVVKKRRKRLLKREMVKREKLRRLGIQYSFPGFEGNTIAGNAEKKKDD